MSPEFVDLSVNESFRWITTTLKLSAKVNLGCFKRYDLKVSICGKLLSFLELFKASSKEPKPLCIEAWTKNLATQNNFIIQNCIRSLEFEILWGYPDLTKCETSCYLVR